MANREGLRNIALTSIYGRRLGLGFLSTGQAASSKNAFDLLQGMDDIRRPISTGPTTGTPEDPTGISYLVGTSAASTPVYQLAPPIPGVRKTIFFGSTDSAIYIRPSVATHAFAGTSLGNTGCGAIRSSGGGYVMLEGLTTSLYGVVNVSSTAVNGVAFQATT